MLVENKYGCLEDISFKIKINLVKKLVLIGIILMVFYFAYKPIYEDHKKSNEINIVDYLYKVLLGFVVIIPYILYVI